MNAHFFTGPSLPIDGGSVPVSSLVRVTVPTTLGNHLFIPSLGVDPANRALDWRKNIITTQP